MTALLWGFEKGHTSLLSTMHSAYQVSGGKENKAILSGSLNADLNTAELQKIILENISCIAAYGCSP
jgi:hypothetical protein